AYDLLNGSIEKEGLDKNKDYLLSFWCSHQGAAPIVLQVNRRIIEIPADTTQYVFLKIGHKERISLGVRFSNLEPILIDDVRLHPMEAEMTTYTYDPLIGVKSVTDPSHRTVHYLYDGLGRLIGTQDDNRHFTKTYNYLYKNDH
ncbi:MAG: hypothetical protein ACFB0B_14120, partial [Thermonemataceae bacterium]